MYAAEEKERRIKKEANRLKKIYAKMDGDRMSLVIGTIQRAAFLRVSLEELEGDLNENGYSHSSRETRSPTIGSGRTRKHTKASMIAI